MCVSLFKAPVEKTIIYTVVYETAVKWAAEYLLLSTFKFYFIEQ